MSLADVTRLLEMTTNFFLTIKLNEPIMVSMRRLCNIIDVPSDSNFLVIKGWNSMC